MQKKRCEKKVPENTQDYDWKGILFRTYHPNPVLRIGSSRQLKAKEATTSTPGTDLCRNHPSTQLDTNVCVSTCSLSELIVVGGSHPYMPIEQVRGGYLTLGV
jgi:hypothetical protein